MWSVLTMEYYSAETGKKCWYRLRHRWTLKTLHCGKETRDKRPRLMVLWFHLYERSRTAKSIDRKKRRLAVARGWGGGRIKGRWLRGDQHVLKLILLMTAQDCEYTAAAAAKSLQLCPTLCDPHRQQPTRLPRPWDSPGKNTGVGCYVLLQCRKVKSESEVAQSCPTLHNPMDCSLPGSSVHGIFQARVLEWVAIAFSRPFLWVRYISELIVTCVFYEASVWWALLEHD